MLFYFKENLFQIILILLLLVLLAYTTNITSIPDSVILFQDDEFSLQTIAGIKIKEQTNTEENEQTISVGADIVSDQSEENTHNVEGGVLDDPQQKKNNDVGVGLCPYPGQGQSLAPTKKYDVSLLGVKLKTITANVIPNTKVIPLGNLAGIKLYTQGVLVVGMNQIEGEDNKIYKPYEEAGIEQGDSIIKINGENIDSTEELLECVSKCKGKSVNITYLKDGKEVNSSITPVKTSKNTYKLGLWVRDAAAGVGTLSFYDEATNSIASLGHGIQDVDTGDLVDISSGEFVTTEIINVQKGAKENPGRIEGSIEDSTEIGGIYSNTKFGVYGYIKNKENLKLDYSKAINVALRNEIQEGDASIICTLEDGKKEEYSVKIQKVFRNNNEDNKSMIVKITDERLLEKTGGIIQGMSGSPIIQSGKLIGALTHVLVSDPTTGYGVFADLMLSQLRTVE